MSEVKTTEAQTAAPAAAKPETNKLGLKKLDYQGAPSTLCTGCGHDSITTHIISALYESGIDPYELGKMSGIGCSSKTPAYFSSRSFAFNSVHGRMPAVSTGVKMGNRNLKLLGVSGDGDTASIGIGTFTHLIRRNLPLVYIIENNGVYGLTKGQFSATSERGAKLKSGTVNTHEQIDLCALAIELGCSFVARSFSGDPKQLVPLIKAAFHHPGTAVIDVISPCVTFNNHEGSPRSYDMVKQHNVRLQELGFVEPAEPIQAQYAEGETKEIRMPDGSLLFLKKLDPSSHDVSNKMAALSALHETRASGKILTGMFYINPDSVDFLANQNLPEKPLANLNESDTRPPAEVLARMLEPFA
ncbi:MAG TPA: 2-oxoacid:ferredoxin oxidoreductase subunit beta [Bdellovibrionales bacterium]|nr:2-oxoacid:ferredoxin oxidoreductase subunit beta [Bdellovibrionales bacterium]